ncbi:MAG: hypothetical protein HQM09_04075 [Candidatus Riflebacteria bacterium]|nr:hypothetical protein [Candidatus Riflebacteria bacterium]
MVFILVGLIFLVLGLMGMYIWWWFLVEIIKGLVALSLTVLGTVFIITGGRILLRGSKQESDEKEE